jgi:phage/plasmid-like protein (TIGR03299 family)
MTQMIDVNEEFSAQRQRQMDASGARRMDDGSWVGTTGWDANEVIGQDGLDMTLGRAALYTTTPAWHRLGTVIPGGLSDIDEVMRLGGIAYEVRKVQSMYVWQGELREHLDAFDTVRTDTGLALGRVGKDYTPIQPRYGFEFLQKLVADGRVIFESAGGLRDGRKMFISVRLPESIRIDAEGINDEIIPFIVVVNSHDGGSKFTVVVTPWRPVCGNTERLAVADAFTTWKIKHTKNAINHLDQARRTLRLSFTYFDQFAEEETALARTDLAIKEFEDLIAGLWEKDQDKDTKAAQKRRDQLHGLFETETERVGRTAYAAERAVTDWLDHVAPRASKTMSDEIARGTRVLEGGDDQLKTAAHQRLMLVRTNR